MQIVIRFCLVLISLNYSLNLFAQNNKDFDLMLSHDFSDSLIRQNRQVTFGVGRANNNVLRYNPVSLIFSGMMYSYQKWISPQISSDCLYSPSCSDYSKLLFREYGFFKGLFASADRLMRCDRISATTINPVSVDEKDGKVHEEVSRYRIKSR
jgi:uncharacterized protein